jgi:hypothetical protein
LHRINMRLALLVVAAAAFMLPAAASADIQSSQVTSPADGTFLLDNEFHSTPDQFHFAGTTSGGSPGDTVDVRCYYDGDWNNVATGVSLAGDGSFSGDADVNKIVGDACVLRAVPSGTNPDVLSAFTGPRLAPTEIRKGNPFTDISQNNGIWDFYLQDAGFKAFADYDSWQSCGLDDSYAYPPGTSFDDPSNYMFYCNAYAYYRGDGFTPGARVDGHVAYSADGVARVDGSGTTLQVGQSPDNQPVRSIGYDPQWDPATGNVTIHETDPLMRCQQSDNSDYDVVNSPTTGTTACDHLADVGVTVNRTITQTNDGQTVKIADDYTSTDGQAHTISLLLEQDFDGDPLFKFAGDSDYIGRSDFESVPGPSSSPTTIYVRNNRESSSNSQPIAQFGAITTPSGWDSADFYGNDGFYLSYRNRQVPAGGSLHLEWTYNTTYFEPQQVAFARQAEDVYVGPSVTITAPANGSTSTTSPVTVTGTATDNVGVTSLTINGVAVTPAADGSFSTPVALTKGANTITAIAKDGAGNTSQAQTNVTFAPPAAKCKVPNVKKKTLKSAKKAIKKAGCTVGKVKSKKSKKVKPGRVISQSVKAGRSVKAGTKVGLTVSKKGKVSPKK